MQQKWLCLKSGLRNPGLQVLTLSMGGGSKATAGNGVQHGGPTNSTSLAGA